MTDETAEAYGERFKQDWSKESRKLLEFTQTDPFRTVAKEMQIAMDAILHRRFTDPRARTIKSLLLVIMLGQVLEEWVKPRDAPLAKIYRELLSIVARESALGHIILERAASEGVEYTNQMVTAVMAILRVKPSSPPGEGG